MPYSDPEKRKAAQRRWYQRNRVKIAQKTKELRREKNTYARERRGELTAWVRSLKDKPCQDCGDQFPPCCMDFDHVRGEKITTVTRLINFGYSREAILAEIAKCDLVCANCHRIRHFA